MSGEIVVKAAACCAFEPSYRARLSSVELKRRLESLRDLMRECRLCPHACGARRFEGRYGVCHSTDALMISSAGPHYGEEPPLTGTKGSGTIFFASCNLKCAFCQNYDISQLRMGRHVSADELGSIMLRLEATGCHNINLVTPTHLAPLIVEAVSFAAEKGLSLPLVYNCGGYESVEVLTLLEDIVDIYMPDIKYADNEAARKYSGAPGYWEAVKAAMREMHRQVGELLVNENGIAARGVLVRHLVLPNNLAGSRAVLDFLAREISPSTYVNIMDQFRPAYRSLRYSELSRNITMREYRDVRAYASSIGLHRGFASEIQ